MAFLFAALWVSGSNAGHAAPEPNQFADQPMPPQPDGDRLVRLLKRIADEGVLIDPERMAKELDIAMTFETTTPKEESRGCEAGGSNKSFLVTKVTVGESWFKPGPEGVQNMKVPAYTINPSSVAGKPVVDFSLYRKVRCKTPNHTNIEARLSFGNLSSYSCMTPGRLQHLIGAEYYMATDGVSDSIYRPPATDAYGVRLSFVFRAGANCALSATIDQESRLGFHQQRAFAKWRACLDKAKADYCATHPGLKASDVGKLLDYERRSCESQDAYLAREPPDGGPPPPWRDREPTNNPCDD